MLRSVNDNIVSSLQRQLSSRQTVSVSLIKVVKRFSARPNRRGIEESQRLIPDINVQTIDIEAAGPPA